jgi:hypothetical protein
MHEVEAVPLSRLRTFPAQYMLLETLHTRHAVQRQRDRSGRQSLDEDLHPAFPASVPNSQPCLVEKNGKGKKKSLECVEGEEEITQKACLWASSSPSPLLVGLGLGPRYPRRPSVSYSQGGPCCRWAEAEPR